MKKLILVLLFLIMPISSWAAWTTAVTLDQEFQYSNDQRMLRYKITATSDASASGDVTLSTALVTTYGAEKGRLYLERMQGGVLYGVEYVPGAAPNVPTTEGDITIDTADGIIILSESVASADTGEFFDGDVDAGILPPLTDFIFACTTLADTKTATFYIWILR